MLFQVKKFSKNKKAVSEMIGYVLLITVAIALSVIVFAWLKGYVPTESLECEEGVSLFIKEYTYDCATNKLAVELENNGRFSIDGYMIHATTATGQELATEDLSGFFDSVGGFAINKEIKFEQFDKNSFSPESLARWHAFNLDKRIYLIEIIPVRYETIDKKERIVTCSESSVKQDISC